MTKDWKEFEEACKIEPIRSYKLQYVLIGFIFMYSFYQVALHLKLVCIMAKLHIISVQTLTTGNVCGMMIKIK